MRHSIEQSITLIKQSHCLGGELLSAGSYLFFLFGLSYTAKPWYHQKSGFVPVHTQFWTIANIYLFSSLRDAVANRELAQLDTNLQ